MQGILVQKPTLLKMDLKVFFFKRIYFKGIVALIMLIMLVIDLTIDFYSRYGLGS